MSRPIYAIGDIHGQLAELGRVLDLIQRDGGANAEIVFLGDYTDRGMQSRQVIDVLMEGQAAGLPWTFIKGNHDRMFARFLRSGQIDDPAIKSGKSWLHHRLGGPTTLASYFDLEALLDVPDWTVEMDDFGKNPAKDARLAEVLDAARTHISEAHLSFLEMCPLTHQIGDLLFVHAGIRPEIALKDQVEDDLIWIRDGWLEFTGALPWTVVHGHTALEAAQHHGNRINLDSGAGYGRPLTAAVFEDGKVWTLGDKGRTALRADLATR